MPTKAEVWRSRETGRQVKVAGEETLPNGKRVRYYFWYGSGRNALCVWQLDDPAGPRWEDVFEKIETAQ